MEGRALLDIRTSIVAKNRNLSSFFVRSGIRAVSNTAWTVVVVRNEKEGKGSVKRNSRLSDQMGSALISFDRPPAPAPTDRGGDTGGWNGCAFRVDVG